MKQLRGCFAADLMFAAVMLVPAPIVFGAQRQIEEQKRAAVTPRADQLVQRRSAGLI